jgi:hypothetical protein
MHILENVTSSWLKHQRSFPKPTDPQWDKLRSISAVILNDPTEADALRLLKLMGGISIRVAVHLCRDLPVLRFRLMREQGMRPDAVIHPLRGLQEVLCVSNETVEVLTESGHRAWTPNDLFNALLWAWERGEHPSFSKARQIICNMVADALVKHAPPPRSKKRLEAARRVGPVPVARKSGEIDFLPPDDDFLDADLFPRTTPLADEIDALMQAPQSPSDIPSEPFDAVGSLSPLRLKICPRSILVRGRCLLC